MRLTAFATLILSIVSMGCAQEQSDKIVGSWQSMEDEGRSVLLEFTKSGDYNLTLNGAVSTSAIDNFGQIKYQVEKTRGPMEISLYDEKTKKVYSRLLARFAADDQVELELFVNDRSVDRLRLKKL